MDIPIQEKRTSLLVVRFTKSEMTRIKAFKKSNKQINVSHIVRQHLLKLIDECTNVHTNAENSTRIAKYPLTKSEAYQA